MILLIFKIALALYVLGVISALIFNYDIKKAKGSKGIEWIECFSPVKMFSVVLGGIMYMIIPMHVFEQYVLRFYDDHCREACLLGNGGKCISCDCNTRAKMWSPLEKDSKNNWGKIIWSKKRYAELRKKYPLKIKIEI